MIFKEIAIKTTSDASELVADILQELGSKGVGIYDINDFKTLDEQGVLYDYVSEDVLNQGDDVYVKGYFTPDELDDILGQIDERLQFLKENSPFDLGELSLVISDTDDNDWVEKWKETQQPVKIGDVTIRPCWIDGEIDDKTVLIDAGTAFGSGQHETTSMCIRLMQSIGLEGKSVVDVGTGSGILGIVAVKLGAVKVDAYDIDPEAVRVARENAILNGVADKMNIESANLLDKTTSRYDVVIANITADVLIGLSGELGKYVRSGKDIIVSGIIKDRKDDVESAFEKKGYVIVERIEQGEWVALRMTV
ncbi:MAG: 50S ribosomal protein L11 methyltransferase [Christensenellales bacterium]